MTLVDLGNSLKIGIVGKLHVGSRNGDSALVHEDDLVDHFQKFNGMGHQNSGVLQFLQILENLCFHFHVQCLQGIIQEKEGPTSIDRSGQGYSGFLAATQIRALFADFCGVSRWENVEIPSKAAGLDGLIIFRSLVRLPK